MALPIREMVVLDVVEDSLTLIAGGPDYNYELRLIERERTADLTDTDPIPGVFVYEITDRKIVGDCNTSETRSMRLWLSCVVPGINDKGTAMNLMVSDVRKAIMIDRTRGGWAIDTDIEDIIFRPASSSDATESVVIILVDILYRHLATDDTVLA